MNLFLCYNKIRSCSYADNIDEEVIRSTVSLLQNEIMPHLDTRNF